MCYQSLGKSASLSWSEFIKKQKKKIDKSKNCYLRLNTKNIKVITEGFHNYTIYISTLGQNTSLRFIKVY